MGAAAWIAIGNFVKAIFIGTAAGGWYAFAVNVARLALLSIAAKQFAPKPDFSGAAQEKLQTIRSTIAPQTFIYGEDMVSGPIIWTQLSSTQFAGDYDELHTTIAMAGHKCDSIISYRLDDVDVPLSDIQSGLQSGPVVSGTYADVAEVNRVLGGSSQVAMALLNDSFGSQWGSTTHTLRGWCAMSWKFTLVKNNTDMFDAGAPQNLRAVVRGYQVYDPRLDTTNGGSGPHRVDDDTTWEWSDNPALCLAHFIMGEKFGMRERADRIDWPLVIDAADVCEELVAIPTAATQKRYTCNATFRSTELRRDVRDVLVGAMMGRLVFSTGLWKMWAGEALTATVTLTEANLSGQVQLQASAGAKERYNRVRGKYIDAARGYHASPYPEQRSAAYEAADGSEVTEKVFDFLHTNNIYEAQRKAILALKQSRSQRVVVFQGNYSCFRIQPGTTVDLDIAEYGFVGEKFFVTEWTLTENGIQLTMIQEDDSVYSDPLEGDYTTRTFSGLLVSQSTGVIAPTGLNANSGIGGIFLSWVNPVALGYDTIEIWRSEDNDRDNAIMIADITGETYVDQVAPGIIYFYWLRSRDHAGRNSTWLPNLTTTTAVGESLGNGLTAGVPDFAPGHVGGVSDLRFALNQSIGGTPVDGNIRVQGSTLVKPDNVTVTLAASDIQLNTNLHGTEVATAFIMFTATNAETRFGETAADWGSGDTRFCFVVHDNVNGWRAWSDNDVYVPFTPISTDCIIAIVEKANTGNSGIEAINVLLGGLGGLDGTDGLSSYTASVYQRSASAPGTPSANDGEYDFGTNTLTPPTGWSITPPAGSDPLYVSVGNFAIVGNTGVDTTVVWSAPQILVQDGATGIPGTDGDDGLSVHVANCYKRSASAPSTPSGGSYNFTTKVLTPPATWSTTPPGGSDPLYVSTSTAEIQGTTGIDSSLTWSSPDLLVQDGADGAAGGDGDDGLSVYVANVYQRAVSQPSTPNPNDGSYNFTTNTLTPPSGWSVTPPAGSNPLWVSTGSFSILGNTGTDGTVVWTAPDNLVSDGVDGADGGDGDDGNSVHTANVYKRATSTPSTPSVNDGSYNFTTNTLTPPSTWSTSPPAGNDPLYISTGNFSIIGQTGIDNTVTWTTPVVFVESGLIRDILFRRDAAAPSTPTGDTPSGWFNEVPGGVATLWQTTGTKNFAGELQGVWSTPEKVSGMQFRGAYSGVVAYILHDVVLFQERAYICTVTGTTGNAPSGTNSGNAWWDLLAGKGDPGDAPSGFIETIAVTGTGPVNLRTLADNHSPAYDGIGDATITFTVASGITLTGNPGAGNSGDGGHAVDTGSWPIAATIALTLENEGTIRAGGGGGGKGGSAFGGINGQDGGDGGDAIYCQEDITIDNAPSGSGTIQAGGSGGGGGGGANYPSFEPIGRGGGGGGGAFVSGGGGDGGTGDGAPQNGQDGNDGTTSGGGTGGNGAGDAGNGGTGGGINAQGIGGTNGSGSHQNGSGGNAGTKGYAVRKNGNTVTATGGTISGTVG